MDGYLKSDAIDVKVRNLLIEVQKIPETKDDLIKLMRQAAVNPLTEAMPEINIDIIHTQLRNCKQILVATNNWYYI